MDQIIDGIRVAVFIDAENIIIESEKAGLNFQLSSIIDRIHEEGQIAFVSAYGDWTNPRLTKYLKEFREAELHQVSTDKWGKNTADMMLALDALEMLLLNHAPDMIVLLNGDRDLVPLVQKIKRYGKPVMGIGVKGSISPIFKNLCNTFLYIDDILANEEDAVASFIPSKSKASVLPVAPTANFSSLVAATSAIPPDVTASTNLQHVRLNGFNLLIRAVSILERKGKVALGSPTCQLMQQLDSSFDPVRLGFASFKSFVLAADKDNFIHYCEPSGGVGDFHMEPSAFPAAPGYTLAPVDEESEEVEISFSYDTPETARDSYRQILLTKKNLPLLPWNYRKNLVHHLWDVFAEIGANGLSIYDMGNRMRLFAVKNGLFVPDRAINKIIQTLNIARCFAHDGKNYYFTDMTLSLTPVVDVAVALDKMNATYLDCIQQGDPNATLVEDGLALMLFDEVTENTLELTRKLLHISSLIG
jgi:hypothetical protein